VLTLIKVIYLQGVDEIIEDWHPLLYLLVSELALLLATPFTLRKDQIASSRVEMGNPGQGMMKYAGY